MKKVKHWLHILLIVLTSGIWILPYVGILATTEMYNRGYRIGKAAGRVERQNEIDEATAEELQRLNDRGAAGVRTLDLQVADPELLIGGARVAKRRVDRFAELAERNRRVGLDAHERAEYFQLRKELSE